MDSPRSDATASLNALRHALRDGNWDRADALAQEIAHPVPAGSGELSEYLDSLKETVILARASRARLAASLVQVRAAAGFQENRRQDFAEAPGICRFPDAWTAASSDT